LSFLRTKAGGQAILMAFLGIIAWLIGVRDSAFEEVYAFVLKYDAYQLDDILLAVIVVGLMSLVYSGLRVWDLRREIALRNAAEDSAAWINTHDSMTALLNRRSFEDRCISYCAAGPSAPLAVFSIDLDGFKEINDVSGHDAGDEVLKAVADRLLHIFPHADVFRTGGDEFITLMRRDGDFNAHSIGAKIRDSLDQIIVNDRAEMKVTVSVGYAFYPDNGATLSEVVRCSDVAMYTAKADRRLKVRAFDSVMRERLRERGEMEMALKEAVRTDAIVPYYQPIIDLRTGQINGFEALARWEKAPGSFVPPMTFIELAEQSDLITELSERLLRQACRDALTWPANTVLSFNISPTQLHDELLGLRILKIISESGLAPWRLEIEITESALIQDTISAEKILNDLHDAKIRVALDDFGTGYSSLGQLSKFSFDKIKIDRSFVSDPGDSLKKDKIMRAIVGLGKGLNILTTAEGIETQDQLDDLTAMGCDLGQGYLFGKAVKAAEALQLFDAEGAGHRFSPQGTDISLEARRTAA
jgi:diguanylate cyclase (GGDEF)-like protein